MRIHTFAAARVLPFAAGAFALLLATANGYGYHRDELYFRVAARHLQWGYPDQPPLTPLLGRVSEALFGETPRGLRIVSALAMAACVVLAALIARELGGAAVAQTVAAACTATSALVLALGHLLSTTTFDVCFWSLLSYLVVRLLRTGDGRLWLALGLVTGIALENKHLVLLFWASILGGLVLGRRLDLLRRRTLPFGIAIAALLWAPNLVWQARHGWPQLELAGQIADEDPVGNRVLLLPFQVLIAGPVALAFALAGLRLLRGEERRRFLPLLWAYPTLLGLALLVGAKPYYAVGLFPLLLGAGGVAAERWTAGRPGRLAAAAAGIGVWFLVALPLSLPIVPAGRVADTPVGAVNEDALETIGWPRFVRQVAAVHRTVPGAIVLTGNYGEAGAVDRYGPALGLPRAYSGHNGFADWGIPPAGADTAVVVGFGLEGARGLFGDCRAAAAVDNGVGVDNEEQGGQILVCRGPRAPWPALWPQIRHLDA